MGNRAPLSSAEKQALYAGKLAGKTLAQLSQDLGCSEACARKWWRKLRRQGVDSFRPPRRGRPASGRLTSFDPRIAPLALALKKAHPGWGAVRVRLELEQDPDLTGLPLPSRSSLAAYFRHHCPQHLAAHHPRPPAPAAPLPVRAVHEQWQLDAQEHIPLQTGEVATICNVRDPVGAAMLASRAFAVQTPRHWRKLDWTQVRGVLREAFTEWGTLPEGLRTDNELGLAGGPNDPFPGRLSLWLAGLGIRHTCIRPGCPTDQPHIERNHRTLDHWAVNPADLQDLAHLQASLDRERQVYNTCFPCQASDCAGRPPLQAHPELLQPRHPYRPEDELRLFNLQYVYAYLATFQFHRKVLASGQVSLGRQLYPFGKRLARDRQVDQIRVRFDAEQGVWVFLTETDPPEELLRQPPRGIDVATLTGLQPVAQQVAPPLQLTLPFFVA